MICSSLYYSKYTEFYKDKQLWQEHSINLQKKWANSQNQEYYLATDMGDWVKFAHSPDSWHFGTLSKWKALEYFLNSNDDYFLYLDLDIFVDINLDYNSYKNEGSAVAFSEPLFNHDHKFKKFFFGFNSPFKFEVSSYVFGFTRKDAESYINWLQKDYNLNSYEWWKMHEDKCKKASDLAKLRGFNFDFDQFGTEEAYFQEAFNCNVFGVVRQLCSEDIMNYNQKINAPMIHYYGDNKNKLLSVHTL